MPGKPTHKSTLQTSFAWLCVFVFLMTSLISSNLYLKHRQVIHRTMLQDMDLSALTTNTTSNPNTASNLTAGNQLTIIAKGDTTKSTTQSASSNSTQVESSNINGNSIALQSGNDIKIQGSNVIANDALQINATRNLSVISAEQTQHAQSASATKKSGLVASYSSGVASIGYSKANSAGQSSLDTVTQQASSVGSLKGSATLTAGETLLVVASDIAAKENLTLIAKNIDLSAAQSTSEEQQSSQSKTSGFSVGMTVDALSAFKDAYKASTKNSSSGSAVGKTISHGEGVGDASVAATTVVVVQAGSKQSNSTQNQASSTARVSTLTAGNNLTLIATDGSITSQGTQISAEGNAIILAKDNITFDVAHNLESQDQNSKTSGGSTDNRTRMVVGSFNNKGTGNGATDTITGTQLSVGGTTSITTEKGDIKLIAANVASEGNLTINAAKNLTIISGQDSVNNANQSDNKAIGQVVISDTERFAGYHNEKHTDNNTQVTQVAANVSSLKGDVTLTAGDKYTQTASNVLAGNDVRITGKTIDITTAGNTGSNHKEDSDLKVGAFARISSPIIDLINNVEAARKSDGRLQTMQGMAAAANAYQAVGAVTGSGTLIKGEVGIGFASSNSSGNNSGSTTQASTINGAGNVTLTTTEGNLHATGANINAGKVEGKTLSLDSAKDIVLDASQSGYHADGKNHSAGLEVGVGYSIGAQTGVYAYVAANVGNGHNNADGITNSNTHLTGNAINLTSKGDTTLKGADAKANSITTDIAGKLSIESVQDVSKQDSSQTNVGGRIQVSFGTAWEASGSVSQSKGSGSSNAVNQQSGLFAGDGGYHIKADSIALKGGAIVSTNAKNSDLTTNKLTTSNLENKMDYKASSASLAGSISGGSGAGDTNTDGSNKPVEQQQLFGDKKSGNVTPGLPMQEKGGASSTTYATLTDGNITIGGKTTTSVKDLGINTDASKAHTQIAAAPDIKAVLKEQQAMSAAAGTVIATSKQIAGDIAANAGKTQQTAQAVIDDSHSTAEQKEQAKLTLIEAKQSQTDWAPGGKYSLALGVATGLIVDGVAGQGGSATANAVGAVVTKQIGDLAKKNDWAEGSVEKTVLHGLAGLIQAKIGGTSDLAGFTAGAAKEALNPVMEKFLVSQGYEYGSVAFNDMMKLGSSLVGAATGAVTGGGVQNGVAGANIALNAEQNNRQLHPNELKWIQGKSKNFAQKLYGADQPSEQQIAQAQAYLVYAAMGNVDNGDQQANMLLGMGKDDSYIEAKKYLNGQKDTFINDKGQAQKVFTVQGGEFYDPLKYSQYNASPAYRDFMWQSAGINYEPPSTASAAEKAQYQQREKERLSRDLRNVATGLIPAVLAGAAGKIVSYKVPVGVGAAVAEEVGGIAPGTPKSNGANRVSAVTAEGTANAATAPKLNQQLANESLVASGADMGNIKVVAQGKIEGRVYIDTNQGARPVANANAGETTLVPEDRVAARIPEHGEVNGNMSNAHAEIGVIQQASNAGVAKGADLTMTVSGEPVCGFCRGDIPAAAQAAGLKSLTIYEQSSGNTFYWQPGMTTLRVKKP